jgi:hypothetical protein
MTAGEGAMTVGGKGGGWLRSLPSVEMTTGEVEMTEGGVGEMTKKEGARRHWDAVISIEGRNLLMAVGTTAGEITAD